MSASHLSRAGAVGPMSADLHPDTGLPRPGTCCGVCPPIAGGGWDCTCPGLSGCPVNAPAAEWDDLARLAQAATPGEWTTYAAYGSRGVEVADTEDMLFIQDGGVTYAVNEADAEFIAAANPATILHLISELQIAERASQANANAHMYAERKANALAARLAAVEALADEWERSGGTYPAAWTYLLDAAERLRAVLSAAPTDTIKETDR